MNTLMTEKDHAKAAAWLQEAFGSQPPVSFLYGDISSEELFARCVRSAEAGTLKDGSVLHHIRYTDPVTNLEISFECTAFADAPAVEWVMHLKNNGGENTPVLSQIHSLSTRFPYDRQALPQLFYSNGSMTRIDDFDLNRFVPTYSGGPFEMTAEIGKPTARALPYFNLDLGGHGVISAIGWTGNWRFRLAAETDSSTLAMSAGFLKTHLCLYPGESIRTPRIALLFWEGEADLPYNLFRRFLVSYHSPRPGGKPVELPICMSSWGGMKTHNHLSSIRFTAENKLNYDCYWIDAGWYGEDHDTDEFQNMENEDWYGHVGNWKVNRTVHPNGMKPISDAAHAAGIRFLLWFEPERAVDGMQVVQEHPSWYLHLPDGSPRMNVGKYKNIENVVLNLGNPEARQWITRMIGDLIEENGVDIFRQDANCSYHKYWENADTDENRIGMTEIRYIEGEYAFLDALLARFPHLLIDNCAGGGTRLDLEMCGRGVPLWRSDYACYAGLREDRGAQLQSAGINHWLPYSSYGIAVYKDTYSLRSWFNGGNCFGFIDFDENGQPVFPDSSYPWDWHRKMLDDMRLMRPYFAADYYLLTPATADKKAWFAAQYNRPEDESGMIECFRREESPYESASFLLKGLEAGKEYELRDIDTGELQRHTGRSLMEDGFAVSLPEKRSCRVWLYRAV